MLSVPQAGHCFQF